MKIGDKNSWNGNFVEKNVLFVFRLLKFNKILFKDKRR